MQNPNEIVSASYDGKIKFWNLTSGCCLRTLESSPFQLNDLIIATI